jgi:hypothetical protein
MSLKKIFFLVIIACTLSQQLSAQNIKIEVQAHGGYLIPHRPALIYLREGHSTGFNVSISKHTSGLKDWQNHYQKPYTGLELGYINTGNKEELGVAYSANRIIDLPLSSNTESIFRLRLGAGLGYLTQHFDKYENVKNAAIGSSFNVSILLALSANKTYNNFSVNAGIRLQHFSNGSFTKPNLGINIPTAFIGIGFINTNPQTVSTITSSPTFNQNKKYSSHFITALGTKSIGGAKNTLYGAWSLAYELRKNISSKFSWNGFTDIGYNNSHPAQLAKDGRDKQAFVNLLQVGAGMGLYNHYGNTAVFLQTGVYLQSQFVSNEGRIYNKFGVEQKINDRFSAQILLKSHLAKADYFALACVYTL